MKVDPVFRALADGTRRSIIDALFAGPLPVHELALQFSITRPAVSKHLRILGEAGLVRSRRSGKENIYQLEAEPLQDVLDWLSRFWGSRLLTLKNLAERKN